LVHPEPV